MQISATTTYDFTMVEEGGDSISMDPRDNGNWSSNEAGVGRLIGSKYGVSATDLITYLVATTGCTSASVTAADMAALTEAQAQAIWNPGYWQAMRCADLPLGIDLQTGDHGYNRGTGAAGRALQLTAGLTGADVDGWIGSDTVAAVLAVDAAPGLLTNLSAAARICVQRQLKVAADGKLGPITAGAFAALGAPLSAQMAFIARLADAQDADYKTLAQYDIYGTDWNRRTWDRCGAALALVAPPAAAATGAVS